MARTASQKLSKQKTKTKDGKDKKKTVGAKSKARAGNQKTRKSKLPLSSSVNSKSKQNTLLKYAERRYDNTTHDGNSHIPIHNRKNTPSEVHDGCGRNDQKSRLRVLKEDTRETHFYQREVEKWRSLSESTLAFLDSLLETATETAKLQQKGRLNTDPDPVLQRVKNQIMGKLKRMKVPKNTFEDYREFSSLKGDLLELREKLEDQEERIENAIAKEEESIQHLQEAEEKLVSRHRNMELHPFIQNYRHVLNIPKFGDT